MMYDIYMSVASTVTNLVSYSTLHNDLVGIEPNLLQLAIVTICPFLSFLYYLSCGLQYLVAGIIDLVESCYTALVCIK